MPDKDRPFRIAPRMTYFLPGHATFRLAAPVFRDYVVLDENFVEIGSHPHRGRAIDIAHRRGYVEAPDDFDLGERTSYELAKLRASRV